MDDKQQRHSPPPGLVPSFKATSIADIAASDVVGFHFINLKQPSLSPSITKK